MWTQELVWLLMNDLDFERAEQTPLTERFLFLEMTSIMTSPQKPAVRSIDTVRSAPSPRLIKSHLPVELLPKQLWMVKPKIIYVTRNAKHVIQAYSNRHSVWCGCPLRVDEFAEYFMENIPLYTPFWEHVVSFWKLRNEPNVLVYSFEEMNEDLSSVARRVGEFLGRPVPDSRRLALLNHLRSWQRCTHRAVKVSKEDEVEAERWQWGGQPTASAAETLWLILMSDSWRRLSSDVAWRVDAWSSACLKGSGYTGRV